MTEPQNNGELLLPVCIPEIEIRDLLSALDLYRILGKKGKSYLAFDAVIDALDFIDNPGDSPCLDVQSSGFDCETFDTFNPAMHFYPNDPFEPDPDNPNLYLQWIRYGDIPIFGEGVPEWLEVLRNFINEDVFGYNDNDCVLVPNLINPFNPIKALEDILDTFTNFPLPTVTIVTEGAGKIGIELLNVPLGGRAIILRDIDITLQEIYEVLSDTVSSGNEGIFSSISIVELERDVISLPPETASTQIQEFEFAEDDTNTLRIIFFPAFNDTPPFLFPFGGIRSFTVCGNLTVKSVETGETLDRLASREGFIMGTTQEICDGVICALEKIAQRILLANESDNIRAGIEVDKDTGEITIKNTVSSLGLPEGVTVTSNEDRNGGVYAQARGIANLFADIASHDTNGFTGDLIARVTSVALDVVDAVTWGTFISDYLTGTENIVISINILAEHLFCNDFDTGFSNYIVAEHTQAEIGILSDFIQEIDSKQLQKWYDVGSAKPRSDYLNYSCVRYPDVEFTVNDFSVNQVESPAPYNNVTGKRLIRVEASGIATGQNGERQDPVYQIDENGERAYDPIVLEFKWSTQEDYISAPNNLIFSENGVYSWQSVLDDRAWSALNIKMPGETWLDTATGEMTFKLIDLGSTE